MTITFIYLVINPSTKSSIYYDLCYYDLPLFPFIFKPKQIVVFIGASPLFLFFVITTFI